MKTDELGPLRAWSAPIPSFKRCYSPRLVPFTPPDGPDVSRRSLLCGGTRSSSTIFCEAALGG